MKISWSVGSAKQFCLGGLWKMYWMMWEWKCLKSSKMVAVSSSFFLLPSLLYPCLPSPPSPPFPPLPFLSSPFSPLLPTPLFSV